MTHVRVIVDGGTAVVPFDDVAVAGCELVLEDPKHIYI